MARPTFNALLRRAHQLMGDTSAKPEQFRDVAHAIRRAAYRMARDLEAVADRRAMPGVPDPSDSELESEPA